MRLRCTLLLTCLAGTSTWAATPPVAPTPQTNLPHAMASRPEPSLPNGMPTQPASAPSDAAAQAINADGSPADDAPEAPHYYRWVDEQGHVHFSDRPPEGKIKKVQKEALTPAPETGGGTNLTQIYQRASNVLEPPAKPTSQGAPHTGDNNAHQPDAPPTSP